MKNLISCDKSTIAALADRLKRAKSHAEYQRIQCVLIRATLGRSGSTNLNSEISGNSDVFGLTDMVGQKGVFHGQAQKEGKRRTTRAQAAHRGLQSPSRLGGAA